MRPQLKQLQDNQSGVFTYAQALCEYTPDELRARVHRGSWVQVFHAVYRQELTPPTAGLRVEAARLSMRLPLLAAGYGTAAELHGFSVLDVDVTHVLGVQRSRPGQLIVHRDRIDSSDLTVVYRTLATTPARTAVDLARKLSRLDAIATLDAALRGGLSRPMLDLELPRHRGRRGYRQAAELIGLSDDRAESPMESRMRLRCLDAGLPHPEPQYEVWTPTGLRRLDLGWPDWRLGLEYDSATWHSGPAAALRDNPRHNWLTTTGWTIQYATAPDVYHHPHHFTEPIRHAIHGSHIGAI
ncbi:hypothetical protein [Nocardia sp. XZ_19_385]|uniref:hypothetical protein n=1 Tax=Nocardia sp. XZ_19_385 TaxID=2769488 RepID=UPI00189097BD|nr:hypothetical protein [Nocardia sp. XZ_19_385]